MTIGPQNPSKNEAKNIFQTIRKCRKTTDQVTPQVFWVLKRLRDHQYSLRDHQYGCRGGDRFVKGGGLQQFD